MTDKTDLQELTATKTPVGRATRSLETALEATEPNDRAARLRGRLWDAIEKKDWP